MGLMVVCSFDPFYIGPCPPGCLAPMSGGGCGPCCSPCGGCGPCGPCGPCDPCDPCGGCCSSCPCGW